MKAERHDGQTGFFPIHSKPIEKSTKEEKEEKLVEGVSLLKLRTSKCAHTLNLIDY